MANKLYDEEAVKSVAKAIRIKLAKGNGKKSSEGDSYLISEMTEAVENIPLRLGFPGNAATKITFPYTAADNGYVYYYCGNRTSLYTQRNITLYNSTKQIYARDTSYAYQYVWYYWYNAASSASAQYSNRGINQNAHLIVPVEKGDVVTYSLNGQASSSPQGYFIAEADKSLREKLRPKD